ncbi:MLO-like protein 11 isoform X4 [Populus alba x Populus x berolinensis]|nr:MLO-like protein 11 isoform X4 [Populus alba x Populus x berolinensis]
MRSLALTPTWSLATVLTILVVVSLIVERSIHRLCSWLRETDRKPLLAAVEKMKEELMLLGFISLLLTASSSTIANICIPSKFYEGNFASCTGPETDEEIKQNSSEGRKLVMLSVLPHPLRRMLNSLEGNTCEKGYEPFLSYQDLERLHRFIFVMAVTHISYSCLTMLLAIVKIHSWRAWEDLARVDCHGVPTENNREKTLRRQTTFARHHTSNPSVKNSFLIWVTCFFRQFGPSVARTDYLTLRKGFIMNHHLSLKYDFHSYMIRSMEEEFQRIVGVSVPLWGFVVAVMLFNVKGSNLYFWISVVPITLVLLIGAKLQHVIATLTSETAGLTGHSVEGKMRPRDDLFWFKKPELFLKLIHFILFQWQFGYRSCFIRNHLQVYIRLVLGFSGQFLCSYSTLPLYALVTQMGTNYKAALFPPRIRETIHGWWKAATSGKRRHASFTDDSTMHRDTSTLMSEEDNHHLLDIPENDADPVTQIEVQPASFISVRPTTVANETSTGVANPFLRHSASVSSSETSNFQVEDLPRSSSMPVRR